MEEEKNFLLFNGYQLGKKIGEGSYSIVKKAYSLKLGRKVAIKIIDKMEGPKDFIHRFLPREQQIVGLLHHKNIIETYEILEASNGTKLYMVMELANGGDIYEVIHKSGAMSEDQARVLFQQLAEAIRYLHSIGVAHRDLKCENALLDHGVLKLTDFGFAKLVPTTHKELSQTFCGSTAYAAPEILQGKPYDSRKGDIWSMGVVLYVMLSGSLPFQDSNIPKMLLHQQKGITLPRNLHVSEECHALMKQLLEADTQTRPYINEVICHPWLKNQ
ncbi:testis-specific serine/threonine-protein kinase 3 [Pelobates fuscus]|uniref:testis-specific serine/threonine-protein kinase 3 n=1 Tax=Pelobates fuscus TaxID=191477 RepID=UPI002FE48094